MLARQWLEYLKAAPLRVETTEAVEMCGRLVTADQAAAYELNLAIWSGTMFNRWLRPDGAKRPWL